MQHQPAPDQPLTTEQRQRLLWQIYAAILEDPGSWPVNDQATEDEQEDSEAPSHRRDAARRTAA
jgi:hypothetical protein